MDATKNQLDKNSIEENKVLGLVFKNVALTSKVWMSAVAEAVHPTGKILTGSSHKRVL